jgi:drug/metabolite transporter (DMT)-like permease
MGFVFLNAASRFAPVVLVAPVASLGSVLTVIYAATFLRERPGGLALTGALLASLGVVLVSL